MPFADDVKIFRSIKSVNDCVELQADKNNLYQWSRKNFLDFNVRKCFVMHFSRLPHNMDCTYTINTDLTVKEVHKDLVTISDTKLSFQNHILEPAKNAYKNLGVIIRNCHNFTNANTIIISYTKHM